MKLCSKCGREYRQSRRQQCSRCYERHRAKEIAYQRWQPEQYIPADAAYIHLMTLQGWQMGLVQISRLANLHRQTVAGARRMGASGGRIAASTSRAILNVPIPRSFQEVARSARDAEPLPVIGTRRRLQSLGAIGYPIRQLAPRVGVSVTGLRYVMFKATYVRAETYHAVAALFDELQLHPGPSDEARQFARERRWQLPLQWDEDQIDEPDAHPVPKARRYSSKRKAVA